MQERYYEIAPVMREYHSLGSAFQPYTMETSPPNFSGEHISTDRFGFRTTVHGDKPVTFEDWSSPQHSRPRAVLMGNSTAFGVGASSDKATIASCLSDTTELSWFNFGGRRYQSTQELLTYLLNVRCPVDTVVALSGINNFDMAYRFDCLSSLSYPPIYPFQRYANRSLAHATAPKRASLWERIARKLGLQLAPQQDRLPQPTMDDFFSAENANLYAFLPSEEELKNGLSGTKALHNALNRLETDLGILRDVGVARGQRVFYALQPIPTWTEKLASEEEKELFAIVERQRGTKWKIISDWLSQHDDSFRSSVKEICSKAEVPFLDLNKEGVFPDEAWIFLDRYHLTDLGQRLCAIAIKNFISPTS